MLTNAAAKAAAPQARAYKLFDAGGLHLFVAPTGRKTWRMRYRRQGREQLLTIGQYPATSLVEARARRDAAREQLRAGGRPRVDTEVNTFAQVARAWHAENREAWSPAHAADVLAGLERDVFPVIGETPIGAISAPELRDLLRPIEARGARETARRIRQRLSMIFAYAIAEGLADVDPAEKLGTVLRKARPPRPQPALTSIEDCRALLAACQATSGRPIVELASRFLALTAVRLDAVRGAYWSEFEDLDGPEPVWRVPAARMKLARAKKCEARFDHLVPLSRNAVEVLRLAAELASRECKSIPDAGRPGQVDPNFLVFPGARGAAPIGEGAIRQLYVDVGYGGRHVPHGWRSSFSTILNEALGEEWRSAIDLALAHAGKDKVEAAYNRAQLLGRRRALYERWGAMLTA